MKKIVIRTLLVLVLGTVMFGCVTQKAQMAPAPEPAFVPQRISLEEYEPKVSNFIVLFDASFSMRATSGKGWKFNQAKEFVSRMNQTIPPMDVTAGMRSFGHHPNVNKKKTALIYGMTAYSKDGLNDALAMLKWPGGETPMAATIDAASGDLASTQGNTAVFVISDGDKALVDGDPVQAAAALKQQYGDRLCIYTLLVGNNAAGKAVMDGIAQAGQCGFASSINDHMSGPAMSDFVIKTLLAKRMKPAPMPALAPPSEFDNVEFDFDKSDVRSDYFSMLNDIADLLKGDPSMMMQLEGNTDDRGSAEYNMRLSERRAQAVKQYLVDQGVPASQLKTAGFGFTNPVASNGTAEGRARNRRVDLKPL